MWAGVFSCPQLYRILDVDYVNTWHVYWTWFALHRLAVRFSS